ncbi:putative ABC-type transport system, permease component [Desulfobacula toluolica Tol2]|uniref:Putative ABC-type transport system, permease component n=2 Tax=Desulfobacula toluolica TaxID=28223 RepID=K0NBX9_DESTT|nr:putative ABC-type transport system, permease component [Desulfobacula toluolica Tol2]
MIQKPLIKTCFRQSRNNMLRTFLLIFGIALGVAGVIAIDIAKTSVSKSFELSTAAITARSTHQIVGSDFKIPQSVFTQLRTNLGIKRSAPVISTHVSVRELDQQTLTLMGIDPFSEMYFRDLTVQSRSGSWTFGNDLSGLLTRTSGVLVSKNLAAQYGINQNDSLTLSFGSRQVQTFISGFLNSSDASTNMVFQGLILADISLAQEILGFGDEITRIDLILADTSQAEQIQKILPKGVVLVETSQQNHIVRQLSRSFETSLTAFSMLALFMGIFLIYNTVSFSITRRRQLNGTLRALGATRGDIFSTVMIEVMIYALVGSVLGTCLGILLGKGAVQAVCSTVSDVYFVLTVSQTHITASTIAKGLLAGILSSFVASVFPAINAAQTLPITLMQRSAAESSLKKHLPFLTLAGSLIIGAAILILTVFTDRPGLDFIGVFLIFFGSALLAPIIILLSVMGLLAVFGRSWGVMAKMALRNIVRSLSRTSVLIASLMVATSVYIGIDIMTGSFRFSIIDWVDGHIGGDIHVSSSDTLNRALSPELLKDIQALPEVASVSAYNIHRNFSRTSGEVHIFSYLTDLSTKHWSWTAAEESQLPDMLEKGWIFVSEIFAQKNHIESKSGAKVILETRKGPKSFKIAGIFRDFFMGGGRIVVSRNVMKQFWGYEDITSMQVFLNPNTAVNPVIETIRSFIPETAGIRVVSGASIKQNILDVFDKTFLITSALQVLTAIVALTGILNSVMAMLLERTRELGILRACGAKTRQVANLLLWECGLAGFISGVMALPLGVCLSWVLINIVNRRAFGWTYDMVISPEILIQAVALCCLATVVAGIFPAIRAGRTDIGKALHME